MKLEEKAEIAWNNYEHREGNLYSNCFKDGFKLGAKELSDDYAIEFSEWLTYIENYERETFSKHTTKELLEIFKKEKGL